MSAAPFPIHPTAVRLKNFRGWTGEHELRLGPELTLVVGENASGKSSTLNAIEWCLFGGEVARKGSGIDERGDWEILNRDAAGDGVTVVLTLAVEGGSAILTRSRATGARPRDPDFVQLELPGGDVLEGEEVGDWSDWNNLPDWATWKQAFCQHQEQLRVRVTDGGERSLQLGRLLGLEAYQEFNEELKALKVKVLERTAQDELGVIEDDLERALARPGAELRSLEEQLEASGVARSEIGDGLMVDRVKSLLDDAQRLASAIRLEAEVPGAGSPDQEHVLHWMSTWERHVQVRKGALERDLGELRGKWQELDVALGGLEPSERRLGDARAALENWTREHGDEKALGAQSEELEKQRQALLEEEKGRNATLSLLRQAVEEAHRRRLGDSCPVCEKETSGLGATMARRIEEQGANDITQRLDPIDEREARVKEQLGELSRLRSAVAAAESEHEGLAGRLRSRITEDGADPAAAARSQLETGKRAIADLEEQIRRIDVHLDAYRSEREIHGLLARWRVGRARADAATGDLHQIAAWDDLQQAVDEAAELACDLETLGNLARNAQEQRSVERVEVVNASLGRHYGRIVGDPEGEGVQVVVKSTATRLTYRLVDASGADITSILNQAALNALSFALLFAQAEDRAREKLPRWLVLDDPGQNLDESGVSGLVEAACEISRIVPVVLATFPGMLSRELEAGASGTLRGFRISGQGATRRIEEDAP